MLPFLVRCASSRDDCAIVTGAPSASSPWGAPGGGAAGPTVFGSFSDDREASKTRFGLTRTRLIMFGSLPATTVFDTGGRLNNGEKSTSAGGGTGAIGG